MDDLQSFLQKYESEHSIDVVHIGETVPIEHYITALSWQFDRLNDSPILVFERVDGYSIPVITNVFSSRTRIARILSTTPDGVHQKWDEISRNLIPPNLVNQGVSQEVCYFGDKVNADRIPMLKHFEQDAGRYITAGVILAKHPKESWINLSFHRLQYKSSNKFGVSLHSRGHLWEYFNEAERIGKNLDVAIIIGMHPAFLIGAASSLPIEVSEMDVVGSILGHSLNVVKGKTVDLEVPADAEIILEGKILNGVREDEGPFGEYTRHSSDRSTRNVVEISAITHRHDYFYLDISPGGSKDHLNLGLIQKEAELLRKLKQIMPEVSSVHFPTSGTMYHCYVSIDKKRPSDGRRVALLVLALDPYVKMSIAVDPDIDITDESQVLWALATRVQPRDDSTIIENLPCNLLDPSSSKEGTSSKIAIDATRPANWAATLLSLPESATQWAQGFLANKLL